MSEFTKDDHIRDYWMVGADLEQANLSGRDLHGVNFSDANLRAADLSRCNLRGAKFLKADLSRASLYQADCAGADFSGADMSMSYYKAAWFKDAKMCFTSFRCSMGKNAMFINTDLTGSDFLNAFLIGARFNGANILGIFNWDRAIKELWMNPEGGKPSYDPQEGWIHIMESLMGDFSLRENSARGAARRRKHFEEVGEGGKQQMESHRKIIISELSRIAPAPHRMGDT